MENLVSYVNFYVTMSQLGLSEAAVAALIETGWLEAAPFRNDNDPPDRPCVEWDSVMRFARILKECGKLHVSASVAREQKLYWEYLDEEESRRAPV